MAKRFLVETNFRTIDNMSPGMTKMNRGFSRFATNITNKNSLINKSFKRMNRSINRVAAIGMAALIAGAGLVAVEYVKLDQVIVGANARFKDTVLGTEQATQNLVLLKQAARDVGKATQFTAVQAGEGLNFYAKAGFTTAEAMEVLADTVDLATVAEADFNRTADISSDLLGALGKNVEDSATKIQNLKDINRALGLTANSANVDLEDMFETLKVAGPVATKAGESMHQLFAITGALGGAGIKGSMGATALKNAYIRLAAPTTMVTSALEKLNLEQSDFIGTDKKMKSMVDIMQLLGDASAGLGDAEQLGIFAEIFGKNAVAGATNLAGSLSQVEEIMTRLEGETKLKELADEIRTGLGNQVLILKSGLLELGLQFIEAFDTDGRGALKGLIDLVQTFDVQPITAGLKEGFDFAKKWLPVMVDLAPTIAKMAIGVKAWSLAQGLLNLALAASPLGLFIASVAALALLMGAINSAAEGADQVDEAARVTAMSEDQKDILRRRQERLGVRPEGLDTVDPGFEAALRKSMPAPQGGGFGGSGSLSVNFNNVPENVSIDKSVEMPTGVNINMTPSFSV